MARIFFKSIYTMALWLLLIINIIFAFNLINQLPFVNSYTGITDYTDKYFGVSTLIRFISDLNPERDFPFISQLKDWIDTGIKNLENSLDIDWDVVWNAPINNIGDFFNAFGKFWENIGKGFLVVISQFSLIIFWVVYLAFYVISFWMMLFKIWSGAYFDTIPHAPSVANESIMLLLQTLV